MPDSVNTMDFDGFLGPEEWFVIILHIICFLENCAMGLGEKYVQDLGTDLRSKVLFCRAAREQIVISIFMWRIYARFVSGSVRP